MTGSSQRRAVLDELTGLVMSRASAVTPQPYRVAVTGITASGKSTLATELETTIRATGAPCTRVRVDGFHNPREVRYRRGRDSAEGYYRDAYDTAALRDRVLRPLGPGGDGRYVTRAFDLDADRPYEDLPAQATKGEIFVFDGSFLLRPELRDWFDLRVFLLTSFEEAEARGVARDADAFGGVAQATRMYRERYHEAQRIYIREAEPLKYADALVANDDVAEPVLFVRASPGGA